MDIPSLVARIINEDPDDNHPDPSKMTSKEILNYIVDKLEAKPWPEAEPIIAKNPAMAYRYAYHILKKQRWPEAEPYIAKSNNPYYAYHYAADVLKEPWPEAEPTIMRDPHWAYKYAKNILHRPWPEAEPTIMRLEETAYKYAKDVLKRPWPEAEPIIKRNSYYAYLYAKDVLEKPWSEAEPIIKKNPHYAYKYAKNVMHGERWPEAEPYIMKDPYAAYYYARDILERPWPEAEPYIKHNPRALFDYIKNVLKKEWPEAEPWIREDPNVWKKYRVYFNKLKLNKKVDKSKFFKHGYEVSYAFQKIPGRIVQPGSYFTLLINSLEPDVEKAIPKALYSLFDLHGLGKENQLSKFIGWIGGAITSDAIWVQEVQSDLLQRTWQLQSKEKFLEKKNKQLEKKKELLNQLKGELSKLLNYYKYPPLSKAYGLDEKIELLKQEQEKLKAEIENVEKNEALKFYPEYTQFKSKLENLYLKWIEAFYHIVIWYAKKLDKNKIYIIPSEIVAELWRRDVGGEGSVYYRAYDGIAKKLGAKLVDTGGGKWWLLKLHSLTPMESKNYQR